MTIGIIGRKAGMSRLFTEDGRSVPVTIIEASANRITQIKTEETDGYNAVQVTAGTKRAALRHQAARRALRQGEGRRPAAVCGSSASTPRTWATSRSAARSRRTSSRVGQIVDVQGVTKGKGFQGTIKRWNFKMGDATHGNSLSHRSPGSIGQRQTPGRVFPGKKMSGHMGAVQPEHAEPRRSSRSTPSAA